jgi:hypothetical protein
MEKKWDVTWKHEIYGLTYGWWEIQKTPHDGYFPMQIMCSWIGNSQCSNIVLGH